MISRDVLDACACFLLLSCVFFSVVNVWYLSISCVADMPRSHRRSSRLSLINFPMILINHMILEFKWHRHRNLTPWAFVRLKNLCAGFRKHEMHGELSSISLIFSAMYKAIMWKRRAKWSLGHCLAQTHNRFYQFSLHNVIFLSRDQIARSLSECVNEYMYS